MKKDTTDNINDIPKDADEIEAGQGCKVAKSFAPHRFRYVVTTADGAPIAGFNHRGDAQAYAGYVDGLVEKECRRREAARRNGAPEGFVQLEFVFVRPR